MAITHMAKKFTAFPEYEGLLSCSQQLATETYPEPIQLSPPFHTLFPENHFNIIPPSTPKSPEWHLPLGFHAQNLVLCFISGLFNDVFQLQRL
jgi:hypothetical protein